MKTFQVRRHALRLRPNSTRVILRSLIPSSQERVRILVDRVLRLSEKEAERLLKATMRDFKRRHADFEGELRKHCRQVQDHLPSSPAMTPARQLLLGSYLTCEYSIESAALFNPSIVPHFDQTRVPKGSLRFIMSLRATGEGHISSLEFRTGVVDRNGNVRLDKPGNHVTSASPDISSPTSEYEIRFSRKSDISERVLFPVVDSEKNGIEDARFVHVRDSGTKGRYYATYTAYDGRNIVSRLLETEDFLVFRSRAFSGNGVQNKGMALFPRTIDGKYVTISRQDGERLFIMYSDDIATWNDKRLLLEPTFPWEFIQIGNCGSPIETEEGWLLLTHGVGPVRTYSIGAILLDLKNPAKIIGRLNGPLLSPDSTEREGYVPNVVYTCGALLHNGTLVLPYAASDHATKVATVPVKKLLGAMK